MIFTDTNGQFWPADQLATVSRFLLPALLASSVLVSFYTAILDLIIKNISTAPRGSEESSSSTLTACTCILEKYIISPSFHLLSVFIRMPNIK